MRPLSSQPSRRFATRRTPRRPPRQLEFRDPEYHSESGERILAMEMAQTLLTVQHQGRAAQVDACRIVFSAHQCFSRDGGADDRRCLEILARHLTGEPGLAAAIDGDGAFVRYALGQVPALKDAFRCVIVENDAAADTLP